MEALLRWQHPTLGLLGPAQFLLQARRAGLLPEIDRWFLPAARESMVRLPACPAASHHDGATSISVNLDPAHVSATGWYPPSVRPWAARNLRALRELGVRIAVDDFGAAHASLLHVTTLPVDLLKFNRALVTHQAGPIASWRRSPGSLTASASA